MFVNNIAKEVSLKIVYYGPGLSGKTTNLQFIYKNTEPSTRGEIVSIETETDRTFFFDLLPLNVGRIAGYRVRFHLTTVPGQVFYNVLRKLVLKGVDGIVFVVDSQRPLFDSNLESLDNLKENLAEYKLDISSLPFVFQYNKRDLKNILTIDELNQYINIYGFPYIEASAIKGVGVFETLQEISKLTLKEAINKFVKPQFDKVEKEDKSVHVEASDAFERTQLTAQLPQKENIQFGLPKNSMESEAPVKEQVHVSKLRSIDMELDKLEKMYLLEEIGKSKNNSQVDKLSEINFLKPIEIKRRLKKKIKLEEIKKMENKLIFFLGNSDILDAINLPSPVVRGQKLELRLELDIDIE